MPFLCVALPPARPLPRSIAAMIRDLDARSFAVREKATEDLAKLAREAEMPLRQALQNPSSVEAQRRLERLVAMLEGGALPAETLRAVRAVEVLERIGSREAMDLLRALAQGAPEARLTHEARASLERLTRRHRLAAR
jgi:hypothetical protein